VRRHHQIPQRRPQREYQCGPSCPGNRSACCKRQGCCADTTSRHRQHAACSSAVFTVCSVANDAVPLADMWHSMHPYLLIQQIVHLVDCHAALLCHVQGYSRIDVSAARVHHQAASIRSMIQMCTSFRFAVLLQLTAVLGISTGGKAGDSRPRMRSSIITCKMHVLCKSLPYPSRGVNPIDVLMILQQEHTAGSLTGIHQRIMGHVR
jgi:hypothetical protein